ncbi:MAG: pyrroline-5-carboxylate reductase [Gammaproteobacteria bacterium]|jgi:pyrroline-5-carboxylate reductase|nr:pyrroline-5-carboxylate reductase [Gammaproteobacteria bacterium]
MDNHNLNIGFIGGGNMAQAIISGLVRAGHNPQHLRVSDPDSAQCECALAIHNDIQVTDNNAAMLDGADLIVLAVKPQIMATAISTLPATAERDSCVFLSIAAGTTLGSLQTWLNPARAIVRAMPNQPALVGAGMSVLTATPTTTEEQKAWTQYVAAAMGDVAWISDEALMDAVTAVSGSGPAYFYLFMEILEACGREMGLPAELATRLARQTGFGAGRIADESELELNTLRSNVTSKGGTTAAALDILEQSEFRAIVTRALRAARDRSVELGKNN